jgi:hypothetical protein
MSGGHVTNRWGVPIIFILGCLSVATCAQDAKLAAGSATTESLTAHEIMARVAANQDRSEEARRQYVYRQHIHVATRKTNGKLMREETADYHVVPQADKTNRQLEKLTGKYWSKRNYVEFSGEPVPDADSLDAGLVKGMRDDLIEPKTKDGFGQNQFPFSTKRLPDYSFKLISRETFQGHDVYRISFTPADKTEYDWAGEAYIDATDFEPMYVYTKLSHKLPFAVRTLLGTDVPGVGYSLRYEKQMGGVWFPKTYGTEFGLHVLFLLNREISVSLDNKDFQQTHVDTKMTTDTQGAER